MGNKLEEYSLNPAHPLGQHKAVKFKSMLGISRSNVSALRGAVLEAASESDQARSKGDFGYGMTYELRFKLTTAQGAALVLTGWIILQNEDFPRLTTCYIV